MALGSGLRMPVEPRAPLSGTRPISVRSAASRAPHSTRRVIAPAAAPAPERRSVRLPVRLRLVLALLLVGLSVRWFIPRTIAYWRLHSAATGLSDYAVCMLGSVGPQLLWERPTDFWRLVRRRLVSSPPDARPFAACVPPAAVFPPVPSHAHAYQAKAVDFVEYQTTHAPAAGFSLDDLTVSTERFAALVHDSWPLLSKDPRELLRPSLRARSAPISLDLPVPALGRGLPAADLGYAAVKALDDGYLLATGRDANLSAYWSRDGGRTWSQTSPEHLDADLRLGSCALSGSSTSFRLSASGDLLQLESWQQDQLGSSVALAPAERRMLAFSCDAQAAVAIFSDEARREAATFRLCPAFAHCRDLPVPAALAGATAGSLGLSAARARGATILAVAHGGIVRVFSSRDDGRTWTPPVVAYDASEASSAAEAPTRLLSLGGRVLLYAGAMGSRRDYAVLASDDLGASWRSL